MPLAEREARWKLGVWLALKAASNDEAAAVLRQAMAALDREMPLRAEPVLRPRDGHDPGGVWLAEIKPDLAFFEAIDPDDAKTRCSLVQTYFPGRGVIWSVPVNTPHKARREWPTDIFNRRSEQDDTLLHPAVLAVKIFCEERQT